MRKSLFIILILPIIISCSDDESLTVNQSRQYVIAHRGSYQLNGLPENSRASFLEALSLQVYGVEFDVRQSADGVLVINHDGVFHEKKISVTSYPELLNYRLPNGESIPTLNEFFALFKESSSSVKLIAELKYCDVEEVVKLVDKYEIQDNVRYISFNKDYCDQLVQLGLGRFVLYLNSELSPDEVKMLGYGGICYEEKVYNMHPEWLLQAKKMSLMPCALWPVNNVENMKRHCNMGIQFFSDIPTIYNE